MGAACSPNRFTRNLLEMALMLADSAADTHHEPALILYESRQSSQRQHHRVMLARLACMRQSSIGAMLALYVRPIRAGTHGPLESLNEHFAWNVGGGFSQVRGSS